MNILPSHLLTHTLSDLLSVKSLSSSPLIPPRLRWWIDAYAAGDLTTFIDNTPMECESEGIMGNNKKSGVVNWLSEEEFVTLVCVISEGMAMRAAGEGDVIVYGDGSVDEDGEIVEKEVRFRATLKPTNENDVFRRNSPRMLRSLVWT